MQDTVQLHSIYLMNMEPDKEAGSRREAGDTCSSQGSVMDSCESYCMLQIQRKITQHDGIVKVSGDTVTSGGPQGGLAETAGGALTRTP